MKGIFRALAKIFRALTRKLRAGVAFGAHALDWSWASIFGGGAVEDDFEDVEVANDNVAAARALNADAPAPRNGLAERVKAAGARRDAGQPFIDLFDDNDPLHRKARAWVASLEEGGLRALRYMPIDMIGRHLDPRDPIRAAGLPEFDPLSPERAPRQALDPTGRKLTARTAASEIIRQAKEAGRQPSLADVLGASRRA